MDLQSLRVFQAVAAERSFSRAAQKVGRTQPAVSLAVRRLESEVGQLLIDRGANPLLLTDAGSLVLEYARRFANLERELANALVELRDKAAGQMVIGANESMTLYLLRHVTAYRRLYPRVRVRVRRSLSSQIPDQLLKGDLELGVVSYEPDERFVARVIYTDRLSLVVAPQHRLASRRSVALADLGIETFVAHNVGSPYRETVLRAFERSHVPLNMDVEMPTVESIRKMVQRGEGVAFLPRLCVEEEVQQGLLKEVKVRDLTVERKIRLIHPAGRRLSHAGQAFVDLVYGNAPPERARTRRR